MKSKIVTAAADSWRPIEGNYAMRTAIICPWHEEKTPGLAIDGESHDAEPAVSYGTFQCFGCGRHGVMEPIGVGDVGRDGILLPETMKLTPSK